MSGSNTGDVDGRADHEVLLWQRERLSRAARLAGINPAELDADSLLAPLQQARRIG